jgi:hypothetical protein
MNDDDNDKFDIEAWRKNAEAKPNIETRVGPTTDDDEVQPLVGEVLPLDQEVADQEENNGENDRDEGWREAAREYHANRPRTPTLETKRERKEEPPPELTNEVIIDLAGKTPLQFAQELGRQAKKHKVQARHLERLVAAAKVEQEAEKLIEPYWEAIPAPEPVDAAKLFADIEARILHHVAMPDYLAFVSSLYSGLTWIHQNATHSPILFITSPERESGKSTLVGVLKFLTRRSISTVGISPAALYRSIEKWHPTFVIDEADEAFKDNPDLRQVINSGWTRGSGVIRWDPETHEPRVFSTFCPKIIAMKGKKAPDTIRSRAVDIELMRRLRSEEVAHFRHLDDAGFQRLRSELARWAQDNGEALGLADPEQPEFMNRIAENWRLMFAIADSIGQGDRARTAARRIAGLTDLTSDGALLLHEAKVMFAASTLDYIFTKKLVEGLLADPEKIWSEYGERGKAITEKGVADLLREFRILSKSVGPKGATAKGYRKADFEDAWEHYPLSEDDARTQSEPQTPILPSTRRPLCKDKGIAENSAVDHEPGRREKIDRFSNDISAVDGSTGKTAPGDPPAFPASFSAARAARPSCETCGGSGEVTTPNGSRSPCLDCRRADYLRWSRVDAAYFTIH